jgi:surfeit locus 1 family protein
MTRRDTLILVVALIVAATTARVGLWQLQRHSERRAHNETVLAAIQQPPLSLDSLRSGGNPQLYRRVVFTGVYDAERELSLANRSRRGSPGVHLLTPLFPDDGDTAVLVLRGWIYAADATHAERDRWTEGSADSAVGYVQYFDEELPGRRGVLQGRILQRLTYADAAAVMPYPLAQYLIVQTGNGEAVEGTPPRLDPPVLGEGNHLSYAFQWFAFGAIAIAGTLVFLRHTRGAPPPEDERYQP